MSTRSVYVVTMLSIFIFSSCSDGGSMVPKAVDCDPGPPQDCYLEDEIMLDDDINLQNGSDLEKFCASPCSKLKTHMSIGGSHPDGLKPLKNLKRLERGASLGGGKLKSYNDLENLEYATGLYITGNELEDLSAFHRLEEMWALTVWNAPNLTSLRGLHNLKRLTIPDDYVGRPPELYLELGQLHKLKDLSGLESLEQIGPVNSPGGIIRANDNLVSLKGLESLRRGVLVISDNEKLTDISALHNFQEGKLILNLNRSLSSCAIDALREALKDRPVLLNVEQNAPAAPCP